jgi:hypothetical protein
MTNHENRIGRRAGNWTDPSHELLIDQEALEVVFRGEAAFRVRHGVI